MELVSILIPVYNVENYIDKCLESIINQTYKPIQVVIIDDGSSDRSLEICRSYTEKYPFIEVYNQENSGVASTRNSLLKKVKGKYILFIDSDDWIETSMIEDLHYYMTNYDLDIAICEMTPEYSSEGSLVSITRKEPITESQEQIIKKFLLHKDLNGSLCNKMIKTELLDQIQFDSTIWYGEDALFMWNILQKVKKVGTVDTTYYHYRMNEASISHQKFGPKRISGHKVWEKICNDTHELWPQYINIAESTYAIMDMWLIYYAAMSNYRLDSNIRQYQQHIRRRIFDIIHADHIKANKKIFALGMALSYRLGGYLIRKHK